MAKSRSRLWPILTVLVGATLLLIALPDSWKNLKPPLIRNASLHLGLDLAGGTELDFRISEEEVHAQLTAVRQQIAALEKQGSAGEEISALRLQEQSILEQQRNLTEAIRIVLERRINGLGVSEATITPSTVGTERHLLVECPGIVDVQKCIAVVGKTIQLEFKEEFTEATDAYIGSMRAQATAALRRVTVSGATLQAVGQDLGSELGVTYQERQIFFRDQIPAGMEKVWTQKPGPVVQYQATVKTSVQTASGAMQEKMIPGIFLAEVLAPPTGTGRVLQEVPKAFTVLSKTETGAIYTAHKLEILTNDIPAPITGALRGMQPGDLKPVKTDDGKGHVLFLEELRKGGEEIQASHILIAYKGASNAEASVTRTKDQAKVLAEDLLAQLQRGANFDQLARTQSDGPSKAQGGKLGLFGRGAMVPPFEQAAFALKTAGDVSDVVETQFGFHIIRLDAEPTVTPDIASYHDLTVEGKDPFVRAQALIEDLQSGKVRSQEPAITLRLLFFSFEPTGWKDTDLNGKHFRAAGVTLDPVSNTPVVQITFDTEGGKLFGQLTKKNIGKRIAIFVGGELVSAPVVQTEITGGSAVITGSRTVEEAQQLAQDLNTGAIPAPIYLVGQYTVEATLGAQALMTSVRAGLIGILILMLYMVFVYRLLGLVADIALVIYAVLLLALMKLPLFFVSDIYVVLTLAGIAGVILSLGMAIDANVLIYERLKEELRKGKFLKTAIDSSFAYAWPAIRDGNVSTLITCAILFMIGTSIVRGFAITLAIGVLLSMFTALVVTKWILRWIAKTKLAENPALFPVKKNPQE